MMNRPQQCRSCPLDLLAKGFSTPEGSGSSGVMIIGEALGEKECRDGLPFRPDAPAGSVLQTAIKRSGLNREEFTIYNIVNCEPPGNKLENMPWERGAVEHCRVHLDPAIERARPKVIYALGNSAIKALTGLAGKARGSTSLRGYVLRGTRYEGIPVVAGLHPTFIARGARENIEVLRHDLLKAVGIAKGRSDYLYVETWEDAIAAGLDYRRPGSGPGGGLTEEILNDLYLTLRMLPDAVLATDIETDFIKSRNRSEMVADLKDTIKSIQFSIKPDSGYFLPWVEPWIGWAKKLLALPVKKGTWNGDAFDLPILRAAGCVIGGESLDGMTCLSANTGIITVGEGVVTLKELVNRKAAINVWGMDTNDVPIPVEIVGWHKQLSKGQTWLKIKSTSTNKSFTCTPDHKVWTERGWVEAENLTTKDRIKVPIQGADDVIHGLLLGDGWLSAKNNLLCSHGPTQTEYNELLAQYFDTHIVWVNKDPYGYHSRWRTSISSDWKTSPIGANRNMFFPPPSPRALAIWYMDDGWRIKSNGLGQCKIAFYRFTNGDEAISWFEEKFGKDIHVARRDGSPGAQITLKGDTARAFMKCIAPWVPPCMDFKLSQEYRGFYNDWMDKMEWQWSRIESIEDAHPENPATRYCITVNHPTHRFMTSGGLVRNCWHHMQPDLLKDLQFAGSFFGAKYPWDHLKDSQPELYATADADNTQKAVLRLPEQMKKLGIWDSYVVQVQGLRPVLDQITVRGLPVDDERLDALGVELDTQIAEVDTKCQALWPRELTKYHPSEGYKVLPKPLKEALKGMILDGNTLTKIEVVGEIYMEHNFIIKAIDGDGGTPEVRGVTRWCKPLPFLPNSWQQIQAYMKFRKHPIPKNPEGKDTTGTKELDRLAKKTKDPLYPLIGQYRKVKKMKSTYVGDRETKSRGFRPEPDGRVRAYYTYNPATGQLATSGGPPLLTIPKHGALAPAFRRCFLAEPGHKFVAFDYKGFHSLTTGFEANDPDYMRLARIDIHSFVTGHSLRLPGREKWLDLPDEELTLVLADIKKKHKAIRDGRIKNSTHGRQFGLGPMKFFDMNRESFNSLREVKELFALLDDLFPKVFIEYPKRVRDQAHRSHHLLSEYGYIRWFWEVYKYDMRNGGWALGEDAEAALSFLPSNAAFGMARDALLEVNRQGLDWKYELVNYVHDEFVFHCPEDLVEGCIAEIRPIMEMPSQKLKSALVPDGLICRVDAGIGDDLASMKEVRI